MKGSESTIAMLLRETGFLHLYKNCHHVVSSIKLPPPPTTDPLTSPFWLLTRDLGTASATAHLDVGGPRQTHKMHLGHQCDGQRDHRAQARMAESPSV